jgi:hypothetical protein
MLKMRKVVVASIACIYLLVYVKLKTSSVLRSRMQQVGLEPELLIS